MQLEDLRRGACCRTRADVRAYSVVCMHMHRVPAYLLPVSGRVCVCLQSVYTCAHTHALRDTVTSARKHTSLPGELDEIGNANVARDAALVLFVL